MHVRQVINIIVNAQNNNFGHALGRLEHVHPFTPGKDILQPMVMQPGCMQSHDIFATLCNYQTNRGRIGFFSVLHVLHRSVELKTNKLVSSSAIIRAQCTQFEVLHSAKVVHWTSRVNNSV